MAGAATAAAPTAEGAMEEGATEEEAMEEGATEEEATEEGATEEGATEEEATEEEATEMEQRVIVAGHALGEAITKIICARSTPSAEILAAIQCSHSRVDAVVTTSGVVNLLRSMSQRLSLRRYAPKQKHGFNLA